jgi:hypothetical protein
MNFAWLVGVVAAVIVLFFISKAIVKGIFKAIMLTMAIMTLATILLSSYVIYDGYKTIQMISGQPVLLIREGQNITQGAFLGNEPRQLSNEELWHYSDIVSRELKGTLNNTYILIAEHSLLQDSDNGSRMLNASLLSYYKSGKVAIYPETFTLSLIRYAPDTVLKIAEGVAGK